MNRPIFKHFRKGEQPSAQEYNRLVDAAAAIASSLHIQGYSDSTGFHTRRAPILPSAGGTEVRSAKIQAGGVPSNNTGPFICKLIDAGGSEVGAAIDVWPCGHLGSNNFDGDVHPAYTANAYMAVYLDLDDKWYTTHTFEDTVDCICTES